MNKFILSLFLFLSPAILCANEKKLFLLEEAERHKQEGIKALIEADNMRFYIPDLGKREHMHAIIIGAIGTAGIPDPKLKILYTGLALIGSMATDVYDKFIEYQNVLAKAAYHIDMFHFCSSCSLKINDSPDPGTRAFLAAIDCLTLCDMLVCLIDDELDWGKFRDLKESALGYMAEYRNYFIKEFKRCNGKFCKKMSDAAWELYENIEEVLSEYEYQELASQIVDRIGNMAKNLEIAEKAWQLK